MKLRSCCAALVIVMSSAGCGQSGERVAPGPDGEAGGGRSAAGEPVIFAPGELSTDANELNCALAPDGSVVVFSEWRDGRNTLMESRREGDGWGERKVLPFSGSASDVDPYFSADGTRLYFSSKRPRDADDEIGDSDIWWVERSASGEWGEPALVEGVNSPDMDEYYTSISTRGSLYLSIFPEHGSPGDIFRADPVEGGYSAPERVGGGVSSKHSEHDPFIAPDESYLFFTSDRPQGYGGEICGSFTAARKPAGPIPSTWDHGSTPTHTSTAQCCRPTGNNSSSLEMQVATATSTGSMRA